MGTVRQILHSGDFGPVSYLPLKGSVLIGSLLGFFLFLLSAAIIVPFSHASPRSLMVFAGAASKPPAEEAAKLYRQARGIDVHLTFGGSGFVLSQMKLARRGDVYFPGSSDFMEKAKKDNLVFADTERIVTYLLPALNVQKGNPRNIRGLKDLLRIRLGMADPETVCVGAYAVEVIEKNLNPGEREKLRRNLAAGVESCEKTANLIALKAVDAVIGWRVFASWDPARIETVLLRPEEVPRIAYIPAVVSAFTADRPLAEDFVKFLASDQVQSIFRKHGYLTRLEEARKYTLPGTPVGGEYSLPAHWKRRGR